MAIPSEPIPGANYTSNIKNYPWHRPADLDTYDDAVAYLLTRLETDTGISMVYSMLKVDMPISAITSAFDLQAISKGKMQIDMGIIAAGPLARGIEIFAKTHGLDYEMGSDPDDEILFTPTALQMILGAPDQAATEDEEQEIPQVYEEEVINEGGLMSMPDDIAEEPASPDEQGSMMGIMDESLGTEDIPTEEPDNELA